MAEIIKRNPDISKVSAVVGDSTFTGLDIPAILLKVGDYYNLPLWEIEGEPLAVLEAVKAAVTEGKSLTMDTIKEKLEDLENG